MTWKEFQAHVKGKVFLVGLIFYDSRHDIIEQYQTNGVVEELTDQGMLILKRADGSLFPVPYDPKSIKKAEQGEYRETTTGTVIVDPDYIISGEIKVKSPANVELIKKNGFIPIQ